MSSSQRPVGRPFTMRNRPQKHRKRLERVTTPPRTGGDRKRRAAVAELMVLLETERLFPC